MKLQTFPTRLVIFSLFLIFILPIVFGLQISLNPTQDAAIYPNNNNYGTSTQSDLDSNNYWKLLYYFNVSSLNLPQNAIISFANLSLRTSTSATALSAEAHSLTESWTETGVTGQSRDGITNWATYGGTYTPTIYDTKSVGNSGRYGWDITELAKSWLNGSITNNGVIITAPGSGSAHTFYMREYTTTISNRPNLTVYYTFPLPAVSINSPANNTNYSTQLVTFNCSANTNSDLTANVTNMSLWYGTGTPTRQNAISPSVSPYSKCYQESANVSTSCGGLNTGSYSSYSNSPSGGLTYGYIYINYTKPKYTPNATWEIKHGILDVYNVSIPSSCFNYYSDIINLRMVSYVYGADPYNYYESYGECYNGTWSTITNVSNLHSDIGTFYGDSYYYRNAYDSDWSSYTFPFSTNFWVYDYINSINASAARLFEEAIIWNIGIPTKSANVTFTNNISTDGTYNWYCQACSEYGCNNSETRKFTVDTTPPVSSLFPTSPPGGATYFNNTWTNNSVKVTMGADDGTGVGVNLGVYPKYCNDTTNTCTPNLYAGVPGVTITRQNTSYIRYYSNDTLGNVESIKSFTIRIDSVKPNSTVYFPTSGLNLSYKTNINLNFSVSDALSGLSTCWYNLNGGTNTSVVCNANTTFTTTDGAKTLYFYVNDSANNINLTTRTFTVDTTNPSASLIFPSNNSYNSTLSQNYTATLTDNLGIKNATLNIYNSSNNALINRTTVSYVTGITSSTLGIVVTLVDGIYQWFYSLFDWAGNSYATENNTLTLDSIHPQINITYPRNTTYTISITALNFTRSDVNLGSCWYSTNGGTSNVSNPTCANLTGLTASQGSNIWLVGVNDSANNLNMSIVTFFVDSSPPSISITTPLNNTASSNTKLNINYTASDASTISTCWYSNDTMKLNITQTACANITTITWSEGQHNVTIWANDTLNNINSTSVRFTIDTTYPLISYDSGTAVNFANLSQSNVYIDVLITEVNFANITFNVYNSSWNNITTYTTLTNSINFTSLAGKYWYYVNITDKVNNKNSTAIYNITLDMLNPSASLTTPANNTINKTLTQNFTATLTDNLGIKNATLNIYNASDDTLINQTTVSYSSGVLSSTLGIVVTLVDGIYKWFYSLFDWAGNSYATGNYTISLDSKSPLYSNNLTSVDSGGIYNSSRAYQFNITWTEATTNISKAIFSFDSVNYTMNRNGNVFYYTFLTLPASVSNYYFWANDTANNANITKLFTYVIYKAPAQTSLLFNETSPKVYGTWINATCSAVTGQGTPTLKVNETTITSGVPMLLGARANWTFDCQVLSSQNYTTANNYSNFTITQAVPSLSINFYPSNNINFPTPINVTGLGCPSQLACTLYRNSTLISSGINETLAVGLYNYTYNTTGNANYSSFSTSSILTINKATSITSLNYFPDSGDLTYGTASNFTCTNNIGGISLNLSVDGVDKTSENGMNVIRAAGTHTVNCSTAPTANFTGSSILQNYIINKATPTLTFLANGGTSNLSLTYPQQINISATSNAGTVGLDKDSVNYLTNNAKNITLGVGSYIFRANISGNTNYSDVAYSYKNITITPKALVFTTNVTSPITYPTASNYAGSIVGGEGVCSPQLYRNNVNIDNGWTVADTSILGVGTYTYNFSVTGCINYTNSEDIKPLTVSKNTTYSLSINFYPSNNINFPTPINVTGLGCPSQLACTLYRNSTLISSGINETLAAGLYNYTYNTTGNANYSSFSTSSILTINDTTAPTISFGTGTQANGVNLSQNFIYVNVTWNETSFSNITFTLRNLTATVNSTVFLVATYEINWTNLSNTDYTYFVNISDVAGNKNSTAIYSIRLDTLNPNATLIFPSNNSYNKTASQNFTYSVNDTLGIKNSTLNVWNQTGQFNQTVTTANTLTSTVGVLITLIDGIYKWWVQVWDWAGNTFATGNYTFTLDSIYPNISYNPSSAGNTTWNTNGNIFINVTYIDTNKDTLILSFDNVNYSFTNNDANSYWRTLTGISTGNYNYYVWANDSANNINISSRVIYVDREDPSINLIRPDPINYYTNVSIPFNFTVTDVNLQNCSWNLDGGTNTTISCNSNRTFNTTLDAIHTLFIYANDSSGRIGSANVTFSTYASRPSVSLNYPTDNSWVITYTNLNFNYTPSTSGGTMDTCEFWWLSTPLGGDPAASWHKNQTNNTLTNGALSTFKIPTASESKYTWNIWCNNSLGFSTWASPTANFTVYVDKAVPLIDFTADALANNSQVMQSSIYAEVTITDTNRETTTFNLYNSAYALYNSTKYTTATNSLNWTSLPDGIYYFNVTVNDSAGQSNSTETRKVYLDNNPPNIVVTKPQNLENYGNNNTMQLNYSVTDPVIGVLSCGYYIKNSSGAYIIPPWTSLPGCTNVTFSLPGGDIDYVLYLQATDGLNSPATATINFGIRTISPVINIDNSYFNYLNNTILNTTAIKTEGISTCELWGNWTGTWHKNQTKTGIVSGTSFNWNSLNLTEGNFIFGVWCNDTLNNGGFSFNKSLITDITYPIINVTSPVNGSSITSNFLLTYNISDRNIDSCFITLRTPLNIIETYNNYSVTCSESGSQAVAVLGYGLYSLQLSGRDSSGNENSTTWYINSVSTTSPPGGGGGGLPPTEVNKSEILQGVCVVDGFCDNARGENFQTCPADCMGNLEPITACFSGDSETRKKCIFYQKTAIVYVLGFIGAVVLVTLFFTIKKQKKKIYSYSFLPVATKRRKR